MQDYQRDFIKFSLDLGVLRFGSFTLKSGRVSPYFFNAGLFNSGESLARLGRFFAASIMHSGIEFDLLYGPAYKGIPLASATSIALADHHDRNVPYAYNRKEIKDHGEGGITVGAPLVGRILIIDDVISAGTSVRESIDIIRAANATPAGVSIALDRAERGQNKTSAIQEVESTYQLKVASIIALPQLIEYLSETPDCEAELAQIQQYQSEYGVK